MKAGLPNSGALFFYVMYLNVYNLMEGEHKKNRYSDEALAIFPGSLNDTSEDLLHEALAAFQSSMSIT